MNKAETIKVLLMIKIMYPRYYVSKNVEETNLQVDMWHEIFKDDSFKVVEQAVKALMCTLEYPPGSADVKRKIALITQPKSISEMEAWGITLKAIKRSTYHAEEEFAKLPKDIQKVLGGAYQLREWATMDIETVNSVIQSNFMRSYKVNATYSKEREALPESGRSMMDEIAAKKSKALEG